MERVGELNGLDQWMNGTSISGFLLFFLFFCERPKKPSKALTWNHAGEVWEQPSLPFLFPLTSGCIIKTQRPLDVEQSNAVKPAAQVAWSNKESVETITCM